MANFDTNDNFYEVNVRDGYRFARGLGLVALGVGLLGVSVGYYVARKAAGGVTWSARNAVDTIASVVEHEYEDTDLPVRIDRLGKTS